MPFFETEAMTFPVILIRTSRRAIDLTPGLLCSGINLHERKASMFELVIYVIKAGGKLYPQVFLEEVLAANKCMIKVFLLC